MEILDIISLIVVCSFLTLLYFITVLFDYLNEKCGNYDRCFLRQRKAKLLKRHDKLKRTNNS